nr:PAS domain S-box protein [Azoarcus sp. L1K30]
MAESRAAEARLRGILEFIPVQVWCTDGAGHTVFQNARCLEYVGRPTSMATGRGWLDVIHADDASDYMRKWHDILASGKAGEAEARFRGRDGSYRWFMMRVNPVQDVAGHIVEWCGTHTDIEDRKAAEEALRGSEAYLAQAQALSRTGSFGWNVRTDALYWSRETYCILGFAPDITPTLKHVFERIHPDDAQMVTDALGRVRSGAAHIDLEHRLSMPDGSIRHLHLLADTTRTVEGDTLVVGAVMDVSSRKCAEAALLRTQARFEGILDIAEDAIISIDSEQRILLFNQGAVKTFGHASADVLGQTLDILLPANTADAHHTHIAEFSVNADISRPMARRREVFGRRKDGSIFPAEASISRLELGDEKIFTVILRDVSERKHLLESALASEKVARGQARALTSALNVLASEADPERVIEHALRALIGQLDACSCSVWLHGDDGLMSFAFALEHGLFKTRDDGGLAAISPSLPVEAVWPWPEVFRTRSAFLLADIREGEDFPWRQHVLEHGVVSILVVPMLMADQVSGVIGIRFMRTPDCRPEDIALAQALANHCMLAIQLVKLMGQARQSTVMAERNRIARDLHDTIAQGLTGIIVQLEATADAYARGLLTEAEGHAARARELARESLHEARRAVHALRPQALEDQDLCEALRQLARQLTRETGTRFELTVAGQPVPLASRWEENILRIGQEAMTNAVRHASATHVSVELAFGPAKIQLHIRDNGTGFIPVRRHDGFGLQGIAERVEEMGGQMQINSTPGAGSELAITLSISAIAG